MEYYQDQFVELERIVLESKTLGLMIVMGDFNAHLCPPVGVNSCNTGPNVQGVPLDELMRRCDLYAVSQSEIVTGLGYTYMHAESRTIVDCVVGCRGCLYGILLYSK